MPVANTYDIAGPPGASTIVFVHGMRVTRKMWKPQMKRLSDAYRLIALDLPGHGALSHVPFRLDDAVTTIAEVIKREAPNARVIVVGISLGGYVAMEFGARHPEMAAGLVIASASVEPRGWHTIPYHFVAAAMDKLPEPWLNRISRTFFQIVYPPEKAEPLIAPGFFMHGGSQGLHEVLG
ncbi:MAG: alpha/beta fold hydrolase, partial [Candidatus Acidiferrales bacterium]